MTSQRQSVFVLSHARSEDAGRAGNQKLTHSGPQRFALQRLTIVKSLYSCRVKAHKSHTLNTYIKYGFFNIGREVVQ